MFGKECKKAAFSIPFLLLVLVTFLMYWSQIGPDYLSQSKKLTEPQPGENYGTTESNDPELVMPAALDSLYAEFTANSYTTYPIGFYHTVKLSGKDTEKMAGLLSELTGKTPEELLARLDTDAYEPNSVLAVIGEDGEIIPTAPQKNAQNSVSPVPGPAYDRFEELMAQVDSLLGGGSDYAPNSLSGFGRRAKTYEEALADYRAAKGIDHFSGAHARLFSDYMTLFSALLPAFLMVSECLRDRRAKMRDLIWARRVSSLRIAAVRYFSTVLLSMLPILLLAAVDTVRSAFLYTGQTVDLFAYFKYTGGWILPTVMISAATGMFLTEATDTPIGLAVMLLWWFLDLNGNIFQMGGGYAGFSLCPRHNSILGAQVFADHFWALAANRILLAALSLILLGASALILEAKRKGRWFSYDSFKARFNSRKAGSEA